MREQIIEAMLTRRSQASAAIKRHALMSLMISEIYDAFIAAAAPEEKARKAAEAMIVHENRFSKIESELAVMRWMEGFVIALLSAVALKLFLH